MTIAYGQVAYKARVAKPDASSGPRETEPAVGTVIFTYPMGYILDPGGEGTVFVPPEVYGFDETGTLRDGDGQDLVTLPAGDWVASIRFNGVPQGAFDFYLPADTIVDLSEEAPMGNYNGVPVLRGADGLSAYQVAVKNGFSGTEDEWLATLVGGGEAAVSSVNNKTGNVILTAADVDAPALAELPERVQDIVGSFITGASGVSVSYNDSTGQFVISGTSGSTTFDAEAVRDTIGAALVGGTRITVAVNDTNDTITISTTATANSTDAQLRDRATHTGTQPVSSLSDASTVGREVLTASSAAAIRSTIGLDQVNNTSDTNKPISASAQLALDAKAARAMSERVVAHDGTTGGFTRETGWFRHRIIGGTTRPANMVAGDIWEYNA